jgi:hypothetical protein
VTSVGTEPRPLTTGLLDPADTEDSGLPGAQHGPVIVSANLRWPRYWMDVATRISSSGLIRWS